MKLPNSEHTDRPWRIHELASDFRLEDVWALPTPGGPDDFPRLVRYFATGDTSSDSRIARALLAIRLKVGELLGWDDPDRAARQPTLRDRLPADLHGAPGPEFATLPFASLYELDDEFAAEMANRTVHAVMHIGWVPDGTGGHRGQMAVLVKPNGWLGTAYMAAIMPFRHLIVYPPLMREIARDWKAAPRERRVPGSFVARRGACAPPSGRPCPQRAASGVRRARTARRGWAAGFGYLNGRQADRGADHR